MMSSQQVGVDCHTTQLVSSLVSQPCTSPDMLVRTLQTVQVRVWGAYADWASSILGPWSLDGCHAMRAVHAMHASTTTRAP